MTKAYTWPRRLVIVVYKEGGLLGRLYFYMIEMIYKKIEPQKHNTAIAVHKGSTELENNPFGNSLCPLCFCGSIFKIIHKGVTIWENL